MQWSYLGSRLGVRPPRVRRGSNCLGLDLPDQKFWICTSFWRIQIQFGGVHLEQMRIRSLDLVFLGCWSESTQIKEACGAPFLFPLKSGVREANGSQENFDKMKVVVPEETKTFTSVGNTGFNLSITTPQVPTGRCGWAKTVTYPWFADYFQQEKTMKDRLHQKSAKKTDFARNAWLWFPLSCFWAPSLPNDISWQSWHL